MSISLISAFEFDNRGTYDEETNTMTIKNSLLGLPLDKVADVQLLTPHNVRVFRGEDRLVAKFKITNYENDYNSFLKQMDTYNIKENMREINKEITYKYESTELVDVANYTIECVEGEKEKDALPRADNNYTICSKVYDGKTYKEERKVWRSFNEKAELPTGEIIIGLFTDVEAGENIEWIPTLFGIRIPQWASWSEALNDDLLYYYKMDEGNTTSALDEVSGNNLTLTSGNPAGDFNGIINTAYQFASAGSGTYDTTVLKNTGRNFTVNFWLNMSSGIDYANLYTAGQDGNGNWAVVWRSNAIDYVLMTRPGQAEEGCYPGVFGATKNTWKMITFIVNATGGQRIYYDGAIECHGQIADDLIGTGGAGMIGNANAGMDELGFWNRTLTDAEITQLYNGGAGISHTTDFSGSPVITSNLPANNTLSSSSDVVFNYSCNDGDTNVSNVSLYINNVINYTTTNGVSNASYVQHTLSFADGNYNWSLMCFDESSAQANSSFSLLTIDATLPVIAINNPESLSDYGSPGNKTLNWSITDSNFQAVWWVYNGTNTTLYAAENQTTFPLHIGTYNGTIWANDTVGNINSNFTTWVYKIVEESKTYNASVYETDSQSLSVEVTANSSLTNVDLIYNGTTYDTTQSGSNWSSTIDIPLGTGTKTFYWDFTYSGETILSPNYTQTVLDTNFTLCNDVDRNVSFVNFTFKDESDSSIINNGTIPTSSWVYYLGSGLVNETYSFINNTGNPSYSFCATPEHRNLTVDYTLQYEDADSAYIQRLLNPTPLGFTNTTTDTLLYLLKSTDGIYVTFQVINAAEQVLDGVSVTGTRLIGGETITVAQGTTDAAGSVTFFLDSDFSHTFTFITPGGISLTTSLFPTQSSYTITMGEGTTSSEDCNRGITSSINPTNVSLVNDTTYAFEYILASSYWEVTEFGFVLTNSSGDIVDSVSVSTDGGTASTNYNTGNISSYVNMNYYYVIDNNCSYTNSTRSWYVLSSAGTDWSINNFFTDFINYTDSGLFGLDDFGRAIIVFLIIFLFVGLMSYRFGLTSPAGISVLAFGLVAFFDVGIGLIPAIQFGEITAVQNFPTIFVGLIMVGMLIREVWR